MGIYNLSPNQTKGLWWLLSSILVCALYFICIKCSSCCEINCCFLYFGVVAPGNCLDQNVFEGTHRFLIISNLFSRTINCRWCWGNGLVVTPNEVAGSIHVFSTCLLFMESLGEFRGEGVWWGDRSCCTIRKNKTGTICFHSRGHECGYWKAFMYCNIQLKILHI